MLWLPIALPRFALRAARRAARRSNANPRTSLELPSSTSIASAECGDGGLAAPAGFTGGCSASAAATSALPRLRAL